MPQAVATRACGRMVTPYLLAYLPYAVPLCIALECALSDLPGYVSVLWLFTALTVFDVAGSGAGGGCDASARRLARAREVALLGWAPCQTLILLFALKLAASGTLGVVDWWGLILAVGVTVGGVGMGAAHELIHRPERWQRALAAVLTTQACYPHFAVDHSSIHHARVATHRDPMTARLGESFFDFYPRATIDGFIEAWRHEARRCRRAGARPLGLRNRLVRGLVCVLGLQLLVLFAFGPAGLGLLLAQAAVAHVMVAAMNYVQHYGLQRTRTPDGKLADLAPWHSWDSRGRVSNWLFFELGKHGQHHCRPGRRFHALAHHERAGRLPAGYLPMFALALIPFAWRKAMDRRAVASRLQEGAAEPRQARGCVPHGVTRRETIT